MNKNLIINNPNNKPPKLYYNNLIYEAVQIF